MPPSSFRTLAAEARHEIDKVKGSRFLARAAPAGGPEAAAELVAAARRELADARHHCWAYRLGSSGERYRSSDAGEPGGSAGRPILAQIEGAGLTDCAVVVSRYFGGTKLGVGGLARAYGAAAREVLARAPVREVLVTAARRIAFPYACLGAVQGLLAALALEPTEQEFGAEVHMALDVPVDALGRFERELRDRTSGQAEVRPAARPDGTP